MAHIAQNPNNDDLRGCLLLSVKSLAQSQIFATHPSGMTVEQATEEWAKREDESARSFQEMFTRLGIRSA